MHTHLDPRVFFLCQNEKLLPTPLYISRGGQ
jgi:hypothetical protein